MRVLLIEDDQRLARLIIDMLSTQHYNVDHVTDGNEGMELALRRIHDLAIVDWMLPGRDGPSLCRAIRAAHLPMGVLMLTGAVCWQLIGAYMIFKIISVKV